MNKHKYIHVRGLYAGKTPPVDHITGWAFSDAVGRRACPKCGCDAGFHCESPAGRRVWPPHSDRIVVGPEHMRRTI